MAFKSGFEIGFDVTTSSGDYMLLPITAVYRNGFSIDSSFYVSQNNYSTLPIALFRKGFEISYPNILDGTISSQPFNYKVYRHGSPLFPGSTILPLSGDTAFEIKYEEVKALLSDFTGSPVSGSRPLTVIFSDLSLGSPVEWVWNFGDSTISYLQNPTHTYQNKNNYTVSLKTTSLDGQENTKTAFSYINVSGPKAIRFYNQIIGEPVDHLLWNFGDGTTSTNTDTTVDHAYLLTGDYTSILQAWSTKGSYGDSTKTVNVRGGFLPVSNFIYSIDNTNYLAAHFTDISLYSPTTWDWSWGDGSVNGTSQNPVHIFPSYDTTYSVKLTITNSDGSDSTTKKVITYQNPLPIANFSWSTNVKTVSFTDLTLKNPTSWIWNFGDGSSSSMQNPIHIFPDYDSTYTVDLTSSNIFGSDHSSGKVITRHP